MRSAHGQTITTKRRSTPSMESGHHRVRAQRWTGLLLRCAFTLTGPGTNKGRLPTFPPLLLTIPLPPSHVRNNTAVCTSGVHVGRAATTVSINLTTQSKKSIPSGFWLQFDVGMDNPEDETTAPGQQHLECCCLSETNCTQCRGRV